MRALIGFRAQVLSLALTQRRRRVRWRKKEGGRRGGTGGREGREGVDGYKVLFKGGGSWRLRNAPLGGKGQDGNLFSVILYMSTALGGRVGSGKFG